MFIFIAACFFYLSMVGTAKLASTKTYCQGLKSPSFELKWWEWQIWKTDTIYCCLMMLVLSCCQHWKCQVEQKRQVEAEAETESRVLINLIIFLSSYHLINLINLIISYHLINLIISYHQPGPHQSSHHCNLIIWWWLCDNCGQAFWEEHANTWKAAVEEEHKKVVFLFLVFSILFSSDSFSV